MVFVNRTAAGVELAARMMDLRPAHPLVIALPKGGVPVAAEIASRLEGDLDILLVKRIIAPRFGDVAIGAISEDGSIRWEERTIRHLGIRREEAEKLAEERSRELREQALALRNDRPPIPATDRTVILVDDGLATGSSMRLAIESLKRKRPSKIVVAVPVSSITTAKEIREIVDRVVVLSTPALFRAVGQWYEDFSDVPTEEVVKLLRVPPSRIDTPPPLDTPKT